MPTTTLTPSAQNTADFRKTFSDDDGDAIAVVSVEVVEADGAPVVGADRTPPWLRYTTSTETTAEGPLASRSKLHLDFSVPLSDPSLEHGRTYVIEAVVTDGAHTTSRTFRFYSADFDLDRVAPMALWVSARKGASAADNRAPGSAVTVPSASWNPVYAPAHWGEVAAYSNDHLGSGARVRVTDRPVLPNADPSAAVSVYVVVQETDQTSTSDRNVLRQEVSGGTRNWLLQFTGQRLRATKGSDYTLTTAADVKARGQTVLLEYHRSPDGAAEYRVNGAVVLTATETDGFADAPFKYTALTHAAYSDVAVYTGELTAEQKLWVRRKYKQVYYDHLDMDPDSVGWQAPPL